MKDDRPDEQLDPEALVMQRQAVDRVQRAIEGPPHRRAVAARLSGPSLDPRRNGLLGRFRSQ